MTETFSHLPPFPWRYLGTHREIYQAICDHCGTAISQTYSFRGADGAKFKVGSTCVYKIMKVIEGDQGLSAASRAIKDAKNKDARRRAVKRREAADRQKVCEIRKMLSDPEFSAKLARKPNPIWHRASRGETLIDWVEWMLSRGSAAIASAHATLKSLHEML